MYQPEIDERFAFRYQPQDGSHTAATAAGSVCLAEAGDAGAIEHLSASIGPRWTTPALSARQGGGTPTPAGCGVVPADLTNFNSGARKNADERESVIQKVLEEPFFRVIRVRPRPIPKEMSGEAFFLHLFFLRFFVEFPSDCLPNEMGVMFYIPHIPHIPL